MLFYLCLKAIAPCRTLTYCFARSLLCLFLILLSSTTRSTALREFIYRSFVCDVQSMLRWFKLFPLSISTISLSNSNWFSAYFSLFCHSVSLFFMDIVCVRICTSPSLFSPLYLWSSEVISPGNESECAHRERSKKCKWSFCLLIPSLLFIKMIFSVYYFAS